MFRLCTYIFGAVLLVATICRVQTNKLLQGFIKLISCYCIHSWSLMISKLKKVLLGIAVSAGVFMPTTASALNGLINVTPPLGDNCTATVLLDNGFIVAQIMINGQTTAGTSYLFDNVTNDTPFTEANLATCFTGASAGGSETFDVVFDPTGSGEQTSTIQINSDDADEGTYSFDVSAIGVQPTSMTQKLFNPDTVAQGGSTTVSYTLLANNPILASTNVGFTDNINGVISGVTLGAPTTNTCTGTLTTTGGIVSLSGASLPTPAGFSACQIVLPVTIPAGAAVGTVNSITSQISSTLGGENFTRGGNSDQISIFAPAPQINVQGNGIDIADEDTSAQAADGTFVGTVPAVPLNSTASSTFTIQNPGTAVLNISSITTDNGEFSVSGVPTSVAAGGSETFTVTFDPQSAGNRFGTITINNDASSDGDWRMRLQALATAPNAVITSSTGNGPFSEGDTDAQGNQLVGVPTTVTFTITNNGNEQLFITERHRLDLIHCL